MLAAIAALLVQENALTYLTRHQAADGSWGRRPATCTCPIDPDSLSRIDADPATLRALEQVVDRLHDSAIEDRDGGIREFAAFGAAAVRRLARLRKSDLPYVKSAANAALSQIATAPSKPDAVAMSHALLASLLSGSRFELARTPFGPAVTKGLKWIVSRQLADGGFDGDEVEQSRSSTRLGKPTRSWATPG